MNICELVICNITETNGILCTDIASRPTGNHKVITYIDLYLLLI
jgi:hypothetical protein